MPNRAMNTKETNAILILRRLIEVLLALTKWNGCTTTPARLMPYSLVGGQTQSWSGKPAEGGGILPSSERHVKGIVRGLMLLPQIG